MIKERNERLKLKTYTHLQGKRRWPTEYDLVTSRLLYYPGHGFEVKVPLGEWYQRYQEASPFQCGDWELFADPRETTYAKYMNVQSQKEIFVRGLLGSLSIRGADRELSAEALAQIERAWPVLRFPFHGLQMLAAYVGQMAPSGRIVVAAAFQAADEMRRVQWFAYRMREFQKIKPSFGETSRRAWQDEAIWQPLREVIERLLITYDWGEAFVAVNFCLKPVFDELFMLHYAQVLAGLGEKSLVYLGRSLAEDQLWQKEWSMALIKVVSAHGPKSSLEAARAWVQVWRPQVLAAMSELGSLFSEARPQSLSLAAENSESFLREAGLLS